MSFLLTCNAGMAMISFDLSKTGSCPMLRLFLLQNVVKMCNLLLRKLEAAPRMIFPSIETTLSGHKSAIESTQLIKQTLNCFVFRLLKPLLTTSCEGILYS